MVKIFISYSHADEEYRSELDAHLSMLKRNKHVESWTDRCIVGGEDWSRKIHTNLEESHVILLLISVDFLKSDYCYEVEAQRALEKHQRGDSVIIPIVLRHCDWKESPFGSIQGYPADALPISAWSDKDEAWLNVIDGIKSSISKFKNTLVLVEDYKEEPSSCDFPLKEEFKVWLDDTEVEIAHHRADSVRLRDIFIYPDLKCLGGDATKVSKSIEASEKKLFSGFHLIFGGEQAGKTSLVKRLYCDALRSELNPVVLSGERIKTSEIEKLLKPALNEQYNDISVNEYRKLPDKVLIIDDYACTTVNLKYQNILLKLLKEEFVAVIVMAIDAFQYAASDVAEFDDFETYELLPFGNVKREELIHKWVELGDTEEISEQELYEGIDTLVIHINSFVRKNIVPSKPIYLLAILQTHQSFMPHGLDLTSNGHCYQYLIYRSLEQAKINPSEIDTYLNFMTEFAGALFSSPDVGLTDEEFEHFFSQYERKYIGTNKAKMLRVLFDSKILREKKGRLSFKYRYIYYFYAAKYLADNLTQNESSKEQIKHLIDNLHKEECSNIIIFITHHSKDEWILDEVQYCMMEMFEDSKEAELNIEDLAFMTEFMEGIPQLVLEQREIANERRIANVNKDAAEIIEKDLDTEVDKLDPKDLLARTMKSFKAVELIGQIVRNRYGSLEKDVLIGMLDQAYGVGLRFLQFFLEISDVMRDEIIQSVEHILTENPTIDDVELEKDVKNMFLLLTYGVVFGILRKVAYSVGTKEIEEAYDILLKEKNTPAVRLINQAIKLQFMKELDHSVIKDLITSPDIS